jgi:hypothetical protein
MSEQSEPTEDFLPASAAALRDTRWLAGAIWGGALLTLLVTSWAAQRLASGPYDLTFLSAIYSSSGQFDPDRKLTTAAMLIITAGIAVVLVAAWWAFAKATHGLIAALSDSSDTAEDAPVPGIWIVHGGGRSPLSDVASYIGVAWALIILRPVVLGTIQAFTG